MNSQTLLNLVVILIALLGGFYQFYLKPRLDILGFGREIQSINNEYCKKVPQLSACEKSVLHQPTGLLFLACSNPQSRLHWIPGVGRLNATGASWDDYVATYDPKTSTITRLDALGFESPRGLSLHGMDVVPSAADPSELFIFLVNHRAPLNDLPKNVGADSVIEIFKTKLGSKAMTHIKTVKDPVILTPNDIVGSPDGKTFYFTNDHDSKVGLTRELDPILGTSKSSVGHCDIEKGCHYAIQNLQGSNGIAKAPNGTFYVANVISGGVSVLEAQADNTLVLTDFIPTDRPMDNLSIDSEGFLWAAAFPDVWTTLMKHFADPTFPSPTTALRFSANDDANATLRGEKYKVETIFEDDGHVASGISTVVYDVKRNLLFLSKLVIHQPSGLVYLACSTPESRAHWLPTMSQLNSTGASTKDYVAIYNPTTSDITRLTTPDFNNGRGLSVHGMDVVPSASDPDVLFVYLINHRIPLGNKSAAEVGADSVIEIFKTTVGGKVLEHIRTVEDPTVIIAPNDVVGSADGTSFYFTNDHGSRVGLSRYLELFGQKQSSVGYCHVESGCKFALTNTHASNGIAVAPNGTLYVADCVYGGVTVLEKQMDNTLVVTDTIKTEYALDNLAVDADGQLWASATPKVLMVVEHMKHPELSSPSAAYRISINTGVNAFYGEKYKVEKVFEDDGQVMTGITSVAYDSERNRLFIHGIASTKMLVCSL
ncbi:hypothetical protein CVT26_008165 [Gymnopilus dilepis]|uniref:SMP-30/Gluconolactonase/LRE-like region domain-containing protein n=1 Tax=Gymnopilus dilepis TaxID=231916 RepID=A0A409XX26_9AGAR|nr:hypothetical protein CVT26_008165 [Gymnopilus dilepis]